MSDRNRLAEDMMVDDAAACLDSNDREEFKNKQKDYQAKESERKGFVAEYKERQVQVRTSAVSRGPGNRGNKQQPIGYNGPRSLPALSDTLRGDARRFMPPGASL